jgi:hypothetical protein
MFKAGGLLAIHYSRCYAERQTLLFLGDYRANSLS